MKSSQSRSKSQRQSRSRSKSKSQSRPRKKHQCLSDDESSSSRSRQQRDHRPRKVQTDYIYNYEDYADFEDYDPHDRDNDHRDREYKPTRGRSTTSSPAMPRLQRQRRSTRNVRRSSTCSSVSASASSATSSSDIFDGYNIPPELRQHLQTKQTVQVKRLSVKDVYKVLTIQLLKPSARVLDFVREQSHAKKYGNNGVGLNNNNHDSNARPIKDKPAAPAVSAPIPTPPKELNHDLKKKKPTNAKKTKNGISNSKVGRGRPRKSNSCPSTNEANAMTVPHDVDAASTQRRKPNTPRRLPESMMERLSGGIIVGNQEKREEYIQHLKSHLLPATTAPSVASAGGGTNYYGTGYPNGNANGYGYGYGYGNYANLGNYNGAYAGYGRNNGFYKNKYNLNNFNITAAAPAQQSSLCPSWLQQQQQSPKNGYQSGGGWDFWPKPMQSNSGFFQGSAGTSAYLNGIGTGGGGGLANSPTINDNILVDVEGVENIIELTPSTMPMLRESSSVAARADNTTGPVPAPTFTVDGTFEGYEVDPTMPILLAYDSNTGDYTQLECVNYEDEREIELFMGTTAATTAETMQVQAEEGQVAEEDPQVQAQHVYEISAAQAQQVQSKAVVDELQDKGKIEAEVQAGSDLRIEAGDGAGQDNDKLGETTKADDDDNNNNGVISKETSTPANKIMIDPDSASGGTTSGEKSLDSSNETAGNLRSDDVISNGTENLTAKVVPAAVEKENELIPAKPPAAVGAEAETNKSPDYNGPSKTNMEDKLSSASNANVGASGTDTGTNMIKAATITVARPSVIVKCDSAAASVLQENTNNKTAPAPAAIGNGTTVIAAAVAKREIKQDTSPFGNGKEEEEDVEEDLFLRRPIQLFNPLYHLPDFPNYEDSEEDATMDF